MATQIATPRARALGFGLHRARDRRGMGLRELARLARVKEQDLSHWEHGRRVPKPETVALLLGCLRVEPEERERLLELARHAREPNWLERSMPGVPKALSAFIEYERTATAVFTWEPILIPGLLQTRDYARKILSSGSLKPDEIEQRLMIRLGRRELLTGRSPLGYTALVGEVALRHGLGGAPLMIAQLRHLLTFSQHKNVSLRVMPAGPDFHPGWYGSFHILDFADLPPIVHLEQYRGSAYIYDEDQVSDYRSAAKRMMAAAATEQASVAFIQEVIAELEGT